MASIIHRNILIIKPGAIGDLLQMTPVVRALKQTFPDCLITLLVGSSGSGEIFRDNPNVTDLVVYDRKGVHRSLGGFFRLWKELRSRRFDLVLNFQRSNIRTWFLALATFPSRVLIYHKTARPVMHAVEDYLKTIAPLGITALDLHLDYFLRQEDRENARRLLSDVRSVQGPVITLNPGASHPVNRWPEKHFAKLADLAADRLKARVVIVGGPGDQELAHEIISLCRTSPLDLSGKTPLPLLAAVLEQSDLLVSGDTGPMHLATAVGTPVVALFGAADPLRTGPLGAKTLVLQARDQSCVPCRSRSCSNARYLACMEKIPPEEVLDGIVSILKKP